MSFDVSLLAAGALLILAVLAGRVTSVLGIPSLLAFVGIGMLAGSDGPGGIAFTDALLSRDVGTLALALILFHGGMDTKWSEVRPTLGSALSLATVGVAATAAVVALVAKAFLGYGWFEGLLLGSILAATDAAAVFGAFRASGLRLRQEVQILIEAESGLNDPASVYLVTIFTGAAVSGLSPSPLRALGGFAYEMATGAAVGLAIGRLAVVAFRRLRLGIEALTVTLSIGFVLVAFGLAASLKGSGFLAVYVAGMVVGNSPLRLGKPLGRFHEAASWLAQVAMFLVLGLLVFPSQLGRVLGAGALVAGTLALVARPAGVLLATAPFGVGMRSAAMLSWAGLRGAVPIVLATIPLLAGVPRAPEIFNVVFFVVLVSALVQGTTLPWVARRLGVVAASEPAPGTN